MRSTPSTSTTVLVRMGALVPRYVFAGEYHRLFSCAFLHGGPVHLLFNGYVLYALGSSLERILGTTRFLLLYGIAALAGSLASALLRTEGLSVGASGALWGLLAAEAVLAYRPSGLIPAAVAEGARRAAVTNLALNVVNSFRPHVDMSAHFGGGAAGAVLMLTGLLTAGLPRLGEQPKDIDDHRPRWLTLASALFTLFLAVGFLATLVPGVFK